MSAKARIESLGAFLPATILSMQERVERMANPPQFDPIAITGIQTTRVFSPSEDCLDVASAAALDCLSRSKYRAQDLDIIISCSITRFVEGEERKFLWDPPLSTLIKDRIGAPQAINFDISNACAGMFSGVQILERMIRAGTVKNGLVVSGEYASAITDVALKEITDAYDPQFGSITTGDAGAAVILDASTSAEDCINYFELMTISEYSGLCIGKPSDKNPGFAMYTNNAEMHKKERIRLYPQYHLDYYEKHGSSLAEDQFDYAIYHQVGAKFMVNCSRVASEMFDSPMPEHLSVVEYMGNTASTSHFIVLYQALKEKKLKKNSKILIVPAASGMITGYMSLNISALEV